MQKIFAHTFAHEEHTVGVALRMGLQASVIASQFTAGLTPHTLIQQLKHKKIGQVVLSLIAMIEVGAAEILQIRYHDP